MTAGALRYALKVDVDTHDGMQGGVPRLLDLFHKHGVRATFFLSFGPDNAGKAIWKLLRHRGFFKKMMRTGAPSLYGWRTVLSGTLLPARMIAVKFPDIVKRIDAEGHEVGVHCWDHRLWQDHLHDMDDRAIEEQISMAYDAFENILGRPPASAAAPAWYHTRRSLEIQDARPLAYAGDFRGGVPGYPILDGYHSTTLQVPTTEVCLEELLCAGSRDEDEWVARITPAFDAPGCPVIPLHAEVEGGMYAPFCERLLEGLAQRGARPVTLAEIAGEIAAAGSAREFVACLGALVGRADRVLIPGDSGERG